MHVAPAAEGPTKASETIHLETAISIARVPTAATVCVPAAVLACARVHVLVSCMCQLLSFSQKHPADRGQHCSFCLLRFTGATGQDSDAAGQGSGAGATHGSTPAAWQILAVTHQLWALFF